MTQPKFASLFACLAAALLIATPAMGRTLVDARDVAIQRLVFCFEVAGIRFIAC